MSKELEALRRIYETYDAFYLTNKYGSPNDGTHGEEFKTLEKVCVSDKAKHALSFIRFNYDCYYKNEISFDEKTSVFGYLANYIKEVVK